MIFDGITTINIAPYGRISAGRIGTFDNPLGYIENYLYEKCVFRIDMISTGLYGTLFYDFILKQGLTPILSLRFDNTMVLEKYVDLTETIAAYQNIVQLANLSTNQVNYNDFTLLIEVHDSSNNLLISSSATLRVVNAFHGSKELYIPDELRIIPNEYVPISINPTGSYTVSYYGFSGGSVSLSRTTYRAWSNGEIYAVANTDYSITENCRFLHVPACDNVMLLWLSKEAGGWKGAAFERIADIEAGIDGVEFLHEFGKFEGKRHAGRKRVVYRNASFRTANYLADIVTSDLVLYRYTDIYNKPYEVVVLVDGEVQIPAHRRTTIELTITDREGEWL